MLSECKLFNCANGTLGLHLSRAPWDPYPWVSNVQKDSSAQYAGIRVGDTVMQLNGSDILGKRISEIAEKLREHWKTGATYVTVVVWRNKSDRDGSDSNEQNDDSLNEENDSQSQHGFNQQSLQKFATCLQHIAQLLECPVCLEVIKPPSWQCCNGHVMCNNCRSRSVKCPVCRAPLGPRGRCLLADQLYTLFTENFPSDRGKTNKPEMDQNCGSTIYKNNHHQPKITSTKTIGAVATSSLTPNVGYNKNNIENDEKFNNNYNVANVKTIAEELQHKQKNQSRQVEEGQVELDLHSYLQQQQKSPSEDQMKVRII